MARSFSGATDTIQRTSFITAPATTGTIAFKFQPTWNSGDSVWHELFGYYVSAGVRIEILKYSDNNVYAGYFGNGNTRISFADTSLFASGTWTHIALTWNTATPVQTIYFNASSKGSNALNPNQSTFTAWEIGNSQTTGNNAPASGAIADLCTWNVILTIDELTALTNGQRPHTVRPKSILLNLALDGLSSPEPDYSGNAVNGTVTGAAFAPGPPVAMFTSRWPLNTQVAAPSTIFRKTASRIGTRGGARQTWAA